MTFFIVTEFLEFQSIFYCSFLLNSVSRKSFMGNRNDSVTLESKLLYGPHHTCLVSADCGDSKQSCTPDVHGPNLLWMLEYFFFVHTLQGASEGTRESEGAVSSLQVACSLSGKNDPYHSLNWHLLSVYEMLGMVLGSKDSALNKTRAYPHAGYILMG